MHHARPGTTLGVRTNVLLALAVAALASGCGGARRHQGAMMMAQAQQQEQLASARSTSSTSGTAGTVTPGSVTGGVSGDVAVPSNVTVDALTYKLAPGDLLDVKFPYHPEENERVPVRPDGRINMQVVGDVMAAGLTVGELEKVVVEKSSRTLRDPVVSIVIVGLAEHKVFVTGQVAKPGFVIFRQGMTPLDAIVERGGFTDDAKADQVVHMHPVGEQVQTQKLDLSAVVKGQASGQVTLAPNDIVIVPRTFIGHADVFVDQWIRGLLPTIPTPGVDFTAFFF